MKPSGQIKVEQTSPNKDNDYIILSYFPIPLYITVRDSIVEEEGEEIEDIIKEGMHKHANSRQEWMLITSATNNSYIFNTKLKNLKEFCEEHIKIYVDKVINPKEENKFNFYITQSWLNITKPGEKHHAHAHTNSIISGVYYVSTVENDSIFFYDPSLELKSRIKIDQKAATPWNISGYKCPVKNNTLLLFPSWMKHSVEPNREATTDRISISFNVFAKGIFGYVEALNELIL